MSILDIIILCVILFFLIRGFIRGFIVELGVLAALALGAWAAFHFSDVIRRLLMEQWGMKSSYIPALSLTLTFILVFIIVFLIAKLLTQAVKASGLGFFNKAMGGVFGGVKAMVLLSILFYLLSSFDKKESLITSPAKSKSSLYSPVSSTVPKLMNLLGTKSFPGLPEFRSDTDTIKSTPK